jgi:hypothetical protein
MSTLLKTSLDCVSTVATYLPVEDADVAVLQRIDFLGISGAIEGISLAARRHIPVGRLTGSIGPEDIRPGYGP